jgi:hypothetical protein
MKMEIIKATVTSLVIPNCAATCGLAGAIMLDDSSWERSSKIGQTPGASNKLAFSD